MQRIGSRIQVMHGNAKMTGGGLTKEDLIYNEKGKIVSKKKSMMARKNMRGGSGRAKSRSPSIQASPKSPSPKSPSPKSPSPKSPSPKLPSSSTRASAKSRSPLTRARAPSPTRARALAPSPSPARAPAPSLTSANLLSPISPSAKSPSPHIQHSVKKKEQKELISFLKKLNKYILTKNNNIDLNNKIVSTTTLISDFLTTNKNHTDFKEILSSIIELKRKLNTTYNTISRKENSSLSLKGRSSQSIIEISKPIDILNDCDIIINIILKVYLEITSIKFINNIKNINIEFSTTVHRNYIRRGVAISPIFKDKQKLKIELNNIVSSIQVFIYALKSKNKTINKHSTILNHFFNLKLIAEDIIQLIEKYSTNPGILGTPEVLKLIKEDCNTIIKYREVFSDDSN